MNSGNTTLTPQATTPTTSVKTNQLFISDAELDTAENLLDVGLISVFAVSGIVTNILNLIVFSAQGFHDSVNISLTTMAIWDLLKCVFGLFIRIYGPLGWYSPALKKTWKSLTAPNMVYLQVFCNYVSYILAAYVAFERCLCVCVPFKVKAIFTPRLTLFMMVLISVMVIVSFGCIFFVFDIVWVFDPVFNQTVALHRYNDVYKTHGPKIIEYFTYIGIMNPIFAFVVILVCTIIIVVQLHKMSKFRLKSAHKTSTDSKRADMTSRDKQVVKMLLVVIIVYIVALLPRFALHAGKFIEPEFYYLKRYNNLFTVCANIVMAVDFLNSSVHLFIFLSMSTNFRTTFHEKIRLCGNQKK
ncbi:neuropeptides capa receptor-like [Physella acuta]|uniref:neuropeptides capa receptor-like n=1 Tax=Physella acuta TaxID=109671 RepID=UPI0027DC5879|nr:neuropeptides capa receptor-like [Physella acuta]